MTELLGTAVAIKTTTGVVTIDPTPPLPGQVLTATSETTAAWLTNTSSLASTWSRPLDWLEIPAINKTVDEILVGVIGVSVGVSTVVMIVQGAYQVDWGDGVVELFASGATASHAYNFDTMLGSVRTGGFKQSLVTVTPQAGSHLTSIDLSPFNPARPTAGYVLAWQDIVVGGGSLTAMYLGKPLVAGAARLPALLVRFELFNTGALLSVSGLVAMALTLRAAKVYAPQATLADSLFASCVLLMRAEVDLGLVTNTSNMFNGCYILPEAPLLNTVNLVTASNMFANCYLLKTAPSYNLTNLASADGMFIGCYGLAGVINFNTPNLSNAYRMFTAAVGLTEINLITSNLLVNLTSAFNTCASLERLTISNTTGVTAFDSSAVSSCYRLDTIPNIYLGGVTALNSGVFSTCSSVRVILATGIKETLTIANLNLEASALNTLFTNLATVTGKTITITGNPGAALCNRSIATAKGWTVV